MNRKIMNMGVVVLRQSWTNDSLDLSMVTYLGSHFPREGPSHEIELIFILVFEHIYKWGK